MLTDKHFHNLYRSHNAIANVLSGRTADGTDSIPHVISFTKDVAARAAAAHQLRLILCHCHRVLDLEDVPPLTVKFLWHLTRTGKQTSADILAAPVIPLIHAIKHAPQMVRGRGSLFSILRKYQRHNEQERARRWHDIRDAVPERTLLWSDGIFTLEESTDPRHLVYDTLTLGHCVGTLYNRAALNHHTVTPDHPDAINYLHYWIKIKNGQSRIITLIETDTPLVTIDFDIGTKNIVAVQGKTTPLGEFLPIPARAKEPLFAAIKVLPIRKGGGRLLRSLVFAPDQPKPLVRRITRFSDI